MNRHLVLSWVTFAAIGVIIAGFLIFIFVIDWSGPPKILLPDSEILRPVLESPEGRAFIERYPHYSSSVYQDFYMAQCCSVDLVYTTDDNGSEETGIILHVNVGVSPDLKTITPEDDTRLSCIIPEGGMTVGWTVKGDIIENLQREKKDCWELGPPPLPTDQEIIAIASNTTAGKAYLVRYPENNVIFERGPIDEGTKVRLTPKISEPLEFVVTVAGYDREITDTYIVCSDGDYRSIHAPSFWSSFEPSSDCLRSVHDKLMIASETEQANTFHAKYPSVGLHEVNFDGRFTVTGTGSTIKYLYSDVYDNEAILTLYFKPGTSSVVNFGVDCGELASTGQLVYHRESGIDLDVEKFLQDGYCPAFQHLN